MATKYYHAENCNSRRFGDGIEFEAYGYLAGTWRGVHATEKEAEQALLDSLASDPRTAVTAITEGEYARCMAQKTGTANYAPTPEPYKPKPLALPTGQGSDRIAAKPGLVVQEPEPEPEKVTITSEPLASVEAALVVDKVEKIDALPTKAPKGTKPPKA